MTEKSGETSKINKKLAVRIFMAVITLVVLVLSAITLGWFTDSKLVDGGIDGLSDANGIFEIGAEGVNGKYDNLLSAYDGKTLENVATEDGSTVNLVVTQNGSEIKWMMNDLSNMENNRGNISDGIKPGSYGTLTFYVYAKQTAHLNINFNLEMTLYNSSVRDVSDINDNSRCIIDDTKTNSLTKGHILFFEKCADGVYSQLIDQNGFTFEKDVEENTAYRVDIFWVWPYVADQLILPKDDSILVNSQTNRILADSDNTLTNFFKSNPENFFFEDIADIADVVDNVKLGSQNPQFDVKNYQSITEQWNKADQQIGSKVAYIKLTLTAD